MIYKSNFSERLDELFIINDITIEQLSKKINIDETTARRWRRDANGTTLANLILLAEFFNCSIEYLSGRTDKKLDFTPKPTPDFYISFRHVLKENNITRYQFTKETRFKDQFLIKWKNGSSPHLQTLIEIANYIDCTIDYLVGRE